MNESCFFCQFDHCDICKHSPDQTTAPRNLAEQCSGDGITEKVKHLLIEPSGDMEWVELDRQRIYDDIYCGDYAYDLHQIYRVLGCDCVEQVSLWLPDIVILIDECGKITFPPREHNELASRLYGGYPLYDDIVGPALFFRREGPNIAPLLPADEATLSLFLGVPLPGK